MGAIGRALGIPSERVRCCGELAAQVCAIELQLYAHYAYIVGSVNGYLNCTAHCSTTRISNGDSWRSRIHTRRCLEAEITRKCGITHGIHRAYPVVIGGIFVQAGHYLRVVCG